MKTIRIFNKTLDLDEHARVFIRGEVVDGPTVLGDVCIELPARGNAEIELVIKTELKKGVYKE